MTQSTSTNQPWAAAFLLTCTALLLPGCGAAAVLYNIAPPTVPAVHELPDRKIAVLVDDPNGHLGDPALPGKIGATIIAHLQANGVAEKSGYVSLQRVASLQAKHGLKFDTIPIDEVGQDVGAQQVIHVHIEGAALVPNAGLWRPTGQATVKVIDVTAAKRVFPATSGGDRSPRGRGKVITEMQPRPSTSIEPDDLEGIRQRLAELIGRDTARLFYDYQIDRSPGAKFRD